MRPVFIWNWIFGHVSLLLLLFLCISPVFRQSSLHPILPLEASLNRSWLGAWRARTVKERPPVRLASLWTSTHCRAKNSPGWAGWESQQQRRKLRPGSQIWSASAAASGRAGRGVGSHVSITVSQRWWLFSQRPPEVLTLPQRTQEGRPAARSENHCYLISAFIVLQLGPWMPPLPSRGAVGS